MEECNKEKILGQGEGRGKGEINVHESCVYVETSWHRKLKDGVVATAASLGLSWAAPLASPSLSFPWENQGVELALDF